MGSTERNQQRDVTLRLWRSKDFILKVKELVAEYANEHLDKFWKITKNSYKIN